METSSVHVRAFGLSAFVLKIIACVTMVVDHVGAYLFPQVAILRVIGRFSFPLFAFFIAEGCRYTRNKTKRFLTIFGLALLCEIGYFILTKEITGTVLMTFSGSIPIIYALRFFKKSLVQKKVDTIVLAVFLLSAALGAGFALASVVPVDYGFPGMMLPVWASLFDYHEGESPRFLRHLDRHPIRLVVFGLGLVAVWFFRGRTDLQFLGLLGLVPLAFYNGKPGVRKFKYWFYIFYPAHLAILFLIEMLFF